jgi:hypothetical protein
MSVKKRDVTSLLEKITNMHYELNYDKALEGVKELPKILLGKSRDCIINKDYCQAKLILDNYSQFSKMLRENFNYSNSKLEKDYRRQCFILKELDPTGYFDENIVHNEPRAYEGKE